MPVTTWEAWIYPVRANYSAKQAILSIDDGGFDRTLTILKNSSNFGIFTGKGEWAPAQISLNQWQHVAVVFKDTDIIFYKNGVKYNYGSAPSSGTTVNKLNIAKNPGYNEFFQGKIDEVRIWSRELSQEEIQNNMNALLKGDETGLEAWWQFNENSGTQTGDSSHNDYTGTLTGGPVWIISDSPLKYLNSAFSVNTYSGTAPLKITVNDASAGSPVLWEWNFGDNTSSNLQNPPAHTYNNPGLYKISLTVKDSQGNSDTVSKYISVAESSLDIGLLASYPFNGNTIDQSINENDANAAGPVLTRGRFGVDNTAFVFDGIDDKINAPADESFFISNLTLAAWIRIDGPGVDNPRIVGVGPSGSYAQYYALILEGTSDSRRLWFYGIQNLYSTAKLASDSTWHHAACTFDGKNAVIYIDGQPDTSAQISAVPKIFENALIQIGYSDNNRDYFNGCIDDVRIYSRALSEAEIGELYEKENVSASALPFFTAASPGQGLEFSSSIINESSYALTVTGYSFDSSFFASAKTLPFSIPAGETADLPINIQAENTAYYRGKCRLSYSSGGKTGSIWTDLNAGIFIEDGTELAYTGKLAVTAYNNCRQADPGSICTENNLGVIYRLLKETEPAEIKFKNALSRSLNADYGYTGIKMNSGVVKSDQNMSAEAFGFYDDAFNDISENENESAIAPRIYFNRAWEAFINNSFNESLAQVNLTIAHTMTNDFLKAKAYALRGAINFKNGNSQDALSDFEQSRLLDPEGPIGRLAQDNIYAVNAPYEISGYVKDVKSQGIKGVQINFTPGIEPVITDDSGYYIQNVSQGWTGTAAPAMPGYLFKPAVLSYTSVTGDQTNQDYTALVKGDINQDAQINLQDAVLVLQLLSGLGVNPVIDGDINTDKRIGMEEAVFILNYLSN